MANNNTSKEVVYIINPKGREVGVSPELAAECLKKAGYSKAEEKAPAKKEESKK